MSTIMYVLAKEVKMMCTPAKPQFHYIKVGFKGVKIVSACFRVEIMMMMMVWHFFSLLIHIETMEG